MPEKYNTLSGTAFHKAAEVDETTRLTGATSLTEDQFLAAGRAELLTVTPAETFSEEEVAELDQQLVAACWNFWNFKLPSGLTLREELHLLTPVSLEQYVRAPVVPDARDLAGTMDGLYWDPATEKYVIVDYKTSNAFYGWDLEASGHRQQAAFYAALLTVSPDFPVEELPETRFYITRKSVGKRANFKGAMLASVQVDLGDISLLGHRIRECESILLERSWPHTEYQWCVACEMYGQQNNFGEIK